MRHTIFLLALGLAACAGSPAQISGMSASEIVCVPDDQLCNTYAATNGFINRRTPVVINEVRRRNLDCSAWVEASNGYAAGPSVTEFGLRTMQSGSPQPGAIRGPGLGETIGNAGLGTMGYPPPPPPAGYYPVQPPVHSPTITTIRPDGRGGWYVNSWPQ